MSIESLKEKARRHEQKEEWQKALEHYLQAIQNLDVEEEQDISLFNRVGDLEVRLGQVEQAVDHYERAVDLYVESELPNNAIAVCKKVVRNLPERHSIYLKMGQIRAHQGFLTDARQNFLTYAEQKQSEGDLEEAFRALVEFVELAPEDIEIRLALAAQLAQHERVDEAVEQFQEARRRLILDGREDEADEVAERIRDLAPDAELSDPDAVRAAGAAEADALAAAIPDEDDWGMGYSDFALGDEEKEEEVGVPDEPEPAVESGVGDVAVGDGGPEEEEAGTDAEVGGLEGFDIAGSDEEEEEEAEEDAEPLPTMGGFGEEDEEEEAEPLPGLGGIEDQEEEEEAADLPMMDFGEEEDEAEEEDEVEEEAEPLPGLGEIEDEEEEEEPAASEAEEAREEAVEEAAFDFRHEEEAQAVEEEPAAVEEEPAAVGEEPAAVGEEPAEEESWLAEVETPDDEEPPAPAPAEDDPDELRDEGERLLTEGNEEEAWPLLERAHEALAEEDRVRDAVAVVRRMTEERPGDVVLRQRMVEYAYRTSDEELLVRAYLDLADVLHDAGEKKKALAACQQALDVDPDHPEANELLSELSTEAEPAAASSRSEVASSEEYVDLGSMILDEEDEEKSTRFVVPAEAPSGDEEADFAKMLSQFKDKVAENVDTDDVSAHYDLGTAYKEMGLVDEAIGEFQAALRASRNHLPTYEMLGQCFLEKDQPRAAVRTLQKALDAPFEVEDELLGIYYFLGRAHEEMDDADQAVEFYDKVFALDINFMDVTERLRTLR